MDPRVIQEEQLYWYDHPVPIGVEPGHNEVLYGLQGLDDAVEFEKQRGTMDRNARVTCVLSVSVTHKGLQGLVKDYCICEVHHVVPPSDMRGRHQIKSYLDHYL